MNAIFVWNADPEIIRFGSLGIRWYGLMFALSFLFGTMLMSKIFKLENKAPESIDRLLIYMLAAVVLGPRLGEILFYNPGYYLENPLDIFKIWEGGLASHGGVVAIPIAIYIYVKRTPDQTFLWLLDRIAIIVALSAFLIRLGNFFNSEIIGVPTNSNWGVVFKQVDNLPRHPAQLYESVTYLILFIGLLLIYRFVDTAKMQGLLTGVFLSAGFTARFFIEFLKEVLISSRADWALKTGQLLSIPVVLAGIGLILTAVRKSSSS